MKSALTLGLLATSLLGCATAPPELENGRTYQVEWIGDQPVLEANHPTLTLGADGRAYGSAGCNHWFAPYQLDGKRLSFGTVGSTRKLCSPATLMEQEAHFFKALEAIEHWDVSPIEQLRLWPAKGKPIRLLPEKG